MSNLYSQTVTKPSITGLEVEYATDAAANGWGEHCYDYIIRFEEELKTSLRCGIRKVAAQKAALVHCIWVCTRWGSGSEI